MTGKARRQQRKRARSAARRESWHLFREFEAAAMRGTFANMLPANTPITYYTLLSKYGRHDAMSFLIRDAAV